MFHTRSLQLYHRVDACPELGAGHFLILGALERSALGVPRFGTFILLMGVSLNLTSCPKKLPGDTPFTEATKTFETELTRDQRKAAIKQLQTTKQRAVPETGD